MLAPLAALLLLPAVPPRRRARRCATTTSSASAVPHGLAQNTVTALAQDVDGFTWVGTQGGLHRFDGQQYTVYRQDPRDPAAFRTAS
jgi:ligand-binding sensor domain-containing protein